MSEEFIEVHVSVEDMLMVYDFLHEVYQDNLISAACELDSTNIVEFCLDYMDQDDLIDLIGDDGDDMALLVASVEEWQRTLKKRLLH